MTIDEAIRIAELTLDEYGIKGWKVAILTKARLRTGLCNYETKTLSISKAYIEHNSDRAVEETILHEVSHIIAGPGTGHGPAWKKIAESMGVDPRGKRRAILPPYSLAATCSHCGTEYKRYRRPKGNEPRFCIPCQRIDKAEPLEWKQIK